MMNDARSTICAAIITRNESANIRRCLESLRWVDEVVVVDSGSVDDTLRICEEYKCRIFEREWDGFGSQKNYAFSQSQSDWLLNIDADEAVTDALADEIRREISSDDQVDAYSIPWQSFFLGKPMRHGGWYPERHIRLVRKGAGEYVVKPLHEQIQLNQAHARVKKLTNPVLHYTYPTVKSFLRKADLYTDIEVKTAIKEGRVPKWLILSMVTAFGVKFGEVYIYKGGWKDGLHGFVAACLLSTRVFMRYVKMWEATREKTEDRQGVAE